MIWNTSTLHSKRLETHTEHGFIAAIKFHSHRDMTMPLFGIYADIPRFETGVQAIIYNSVSVTVTREHLNFSVDGVKPKLIAKEAVAYLVFLHPLIGIVSTLRCTSNNLCDITKIYLQPLEHVVISC